MRRELQGSAIIGVFHDERSAASPAAREIALG